MNIWVKKGILLGFSMGEIIEMPGQGGGSQFFDKSTYPLKKFSAEDGSNRTGWFQCSRRLLRRPKRHVHAAHVHQRGRIRY